MSADKRTGSKRLIAMTGSGASARRADDACRSDAVDEGLAGVAPGAPASYVGMRHVVCDSVEAFPAGFEPHAKARRVSRKP